VCFIQQQFSPTKALLEAFQTAVADELLDELRRRFSITKKAQDTVIGGFSAGAALSAYIALNRSGLFGAVLSQSGAFRGPWLGPDSNELAVAYAARTRVPVRFYVDAGLYEPVAASQRPMDEMALQESLTVSNRHFRDVLRAKGYEVVYTETAGSHDALHTRAVLATALMTLLPPR
jgi:enterochelin esterase-like enzyme